MAACTRTHAKQILQSLSFAPPRAALLSRPSPSPLLRAVRVLSSSPSSSNELEGPDAAVKVVRLARAFKIRGHLAADLDPLHLPTKFDKKKVCPEITPEHYGFSEKDLDRLVNISSTEKSSRLFENKSPTLGDVIRVQKAIYCGPIGYEYMHVQNPEQLKWLKSKIEDIAPVYDREAKIRILEDLCKAHFFEEFLEKKFPGQKRFSNEGCDMFLPGFMRLLLQLSNHGAESVFFGMAHRGRLNSLYNITGKPLEEILSSFSKYPKGQFGTGDVAYHMGHENTLNLSNGKNIGINLLFNPSHLETVNPLVIGRARGEQFFLKDDKRTRVVPILVHGDAAFAGQGVVYETIGMSDLENYTVGGTIHIVINNQIGFTAKPSDSRSAIYASDVAHTVDAPVFHVNADNPEAVLRCFDLAAEFRQKFNTDVVVDIVGYRRHGHNEGDDPKLTSPIMYEAIKHQKTIYSKFRETLVAQGVLTQAEADKMVADYNQVLNEAFNNVENFKAHEPEFLSGRWEGYPRIVQNTTWQPTGVDLEKLTKYFNVITSYPESFHIHPALKRTIEGKKNLFQKEGLLDWASAEALAFASILDNGTKVRLSGQDVQRGTFSQRHHVMHDQTTDLNYVPLRHISPTQAPYTVSNSHLSEWGVLGFEYGFSLHDPNCFVVWEAQFGDFGNMAQIIFDQFISSAEYKWGQRSGMMVLLPHGYEGMGPEHSSGRIERFLQSSHEHPSNYVPMSSEVDFARLQQEQCNWIVANPTTPANYFHLIRRQLAHNFRKPLIVFSPKSLLRHPDARSPLSDMGPDHVFQRMYFEQDGEIGNWDEAHHSPHANPNVRRLILCSGKVYYDLLNERRKLGVKDVAIARVEQISPFPFDLVHAHADHFPGAEVVWAQEEPKNQGAWSYVRPRIATALNHCSKNSSRFPKYVGRKASAATATGDHNMHNDEVHALLRDAFAK